MHATSSAEHIAKVIFKYAALISKEQDVSSLIQLNADLARDIAGAERCSLWLMDKQTGELWTRVAHGVGELRIPAGQGIVGSCISQGEILLSNNAQSDKRLWRSVDDSTGYRTNSVLCVPLVHETAVIGALQVLNKPGGFTDEDVEVVRLMAVYAASAIQTEALRQEANMARLLQHELTMAATVQQRLFPLESERAVKGLEYAGLCRPAKFVGGDYYDFLSLPGNIFALTLGDVSGKGMSAAVLMASIQTLLRALLRRYPQEIAAATTELNEALYQSSTADRYSTLFCATVNPASKTMTYVNAGHIPPFIVRHGGSIERPGEGDMPVGLINFATYRQHVIAMDPGDLLVCVSDGVLEAQNENGELWEESRLESSLYELRDGPVREVAARLLQRLDQFVGAVEQFDDITIVIARMS
jgi:sigma-B regulation protein RsbU (phosphoserine phosphatase)